MNSPKSNKDRELEELVAYLDGELQPQPRGAVEKRLSNDDAYLHELQSLDNVWSALDELPQVTVGESFSRSTIEMVTVAAERDVAKRTTWLPVQHRRRLFLFAIVGILAATVGFAATRILVPSTPGEKAELQKSPPQQPLRMMRNRAHFVNRLFSEEDTGALKKEIKAFFEENKRRIEELARRGKGPGAERMIRQRPDTLAAIFAVRMLDSGPGRDELYERLTGVLSDPAQQRIAQLPELESKRQLRRWIHEAFSSEVTVDDLEDYFVTEFSNDEREELLAMPWPEMKRHLFERYQRHMFPTPNGPALRDMPPFRPDQRNRRRRGQRGDEAGPPAGRRPGEPRHGPRGPGPQGRPPPPRPQKDEP